MMRRTHERELRMLGRNRDNTAVHGPTRRRGGWWGWIGGGALGCLITLVALSAPSTEGRANVSSAAPGDTPQPINHSMAGMAGMVGPTASPTPLNFSMAELMA